MTKGFKLPGKPGRWEQASSWRATDEIVCYRRLPEPKPMPDLRVGYAVNVKGDLEIVIGGVVKPDTFCQYTTNVETSNHKGIRRAHSLCTIREVWSNGETIWKRGE